MQTVEPYPREVLVAVEVTDKDHQPLNVKVETTRSWLNWFQVTSQKIPIEARYEKSLAFAQISANSTEEKTVTVTGLTTRDHVTVNKPTRQADLGIVGMRVSAANTLALTFQNSSGSGITPTTETYLILATRF